MSSLKFDYTVAERFLRYVTIDTQSDPDSPTTPSTEKQKDLGRLLATELREIGLSDAEMDAHGYVYATLPANSGKSRAGHLPVLAHGHLAGRARRRGEAAGREELPGRRYRPARRSRARSSALPTIRRSRARSATTSSPATAPPCSAPTTRRAWPRSSTPCASWSAHPEIKHGTLKVLFTPDEEIGRGVDKVDLARLGADFAYTIDGEAAGNVEDETFSADAATVTVQGVTAHPGFAKGRMENAVKIAARIIELLPKDTCSPETTEGREGFVHPLTVEAEMDRATLKFILRDFSTAGLKDKARVLEDAVKAALRDFPRSSYRLEITEQYRNMKEVLDRHPQVVANAMEAVRRAGLTPVKARIRGGTDGSRLSFMGLPCPNIFAGEHAFHSRLEWVSVQDMQAAVRTIVHLAMLWEEQA